MIKGSLPRNGVPTAMTAIPTHPSLNNTNSLKNSTKHIMFANNSYHQPVANHTVIINNNNTNDKQKYLNSNYFTAINICESRWFNVLMVGLAAIAVFNLCITFWVINVLKLNDTGLGFGSVVLTKKGIHVDRDVTIDGTLYAKQIKTMDTKQSLTFDSLTDEKIVLKNSDIWENSLSLGDGKLEVQSNNFQIRSTDPDIDDNTDDILFNVEPGEITLQAKDFLQPSLGGHNINTSLETNSIRGHLYHDLRLESRTQQVIINGDEDIHLESRGGDIMSQSYDNTIMTANDAILMQSKRLEFRNLAKFDKSVDELNPRDSYQLCLCESGQLFAVPPDSVCKADAHWCSTRTDDK